MNLDTAQNEAVTARSTQAECDTILAHWPPAVTPESECRYAATYLECRLNQGVNEDSVAMNCEYNDTYTYTQCIDISTLLNNYSSIVSNIKNKVYNNTDDCPPGTCPPFMQPPCGVIIFTVSFNNNFPCSTGSCGMDIKAVVYCCF